MMLSKTAYRYIESDKRLLQRLQSICIICCYFCMNRACLCLVNRACLGSKHLSLAKIPCPSYVERRRLYE